MNKIITLLLIFTANLLFCQVPDYLPANGLVGWWPFNGNANDESGNGNNGVVNGAILTTDRNGVLNSAYSFDGNADNVVINNSNSLNPSQLSISVWYLAIGNDMCVVSKNNPSDASKFSYNIKHQDIFQSNLGLNAGWGIGSCSTANEFWGIDGQIATDQWVNIILTIDSFGVGKVYYNSNLISTYNGAVLQSCNDPLSILKFGGPHWNSNTEWFNGKIDDIGIWNRALTQQEIANLYNASLPQNICLPSYVPTNGLVGYWPFCGNANDESGNGNHGTVYGATLTTDRLNSGSSAFDFTHNGLVWSAAQHQVINIPHSSSFNSNNISLSLWFNARSYFFSGIPGTDKASRLIGRFENGYSNPNGQTWGIDLINGQIRAFVLKSSTDNNQESLLASSNVELNQWNHIVVTLDNSYLKLFLNGTLVQDIIMSPGFLINTIGTSGISIGCSNQANGYWYESDSKIDDVGFWNRPLTQQEIFNLYNSSLSDQDFAINKVSIYPNPTTTLLNFKSAVQVEKITIYNMLSQLVQQEKMNALEGVINIERLSQGTYIVKVNDIDKGYTIIKN